MPLQIISADERAAAIGSASSDLKWVLADNEVSEEVQGVLYHVGVNRLKIFSGLGENRTEVREALKSVLGIDSADGAIARIQVALVLAAWDASRSLITQDLKDRAEHRSSDQPRPVHHQELVALRSAFEVKFYKLDNREVPSKSYLGSKQEEIEEGEPRAESLRDVSSREDHESSYLTADISTDGIVKVKKGVKEGLLPTNSEDCLLYTSPSPRD